MLVPFSLYVKGVVHNVATDILSALRDMYDAAILIVKWCSLLCDVIHYILDVSLW
jgi:hypothetical protein